MQYYSNLHQFINSRYISQHHIKDLKTIVSWCFRFWNRLLNSISRAGPEAAEVLDGEYIQHQCKDLLTMHGMDPWCCWYCRKLHNFFLVKNRSSDVVAGNSILCCLVWTLRDMSGMTWFCLRDVSRKEFHMIWPYVPPSIFWQMLNLEHLLATKCDRKMSWCLQVTWFVCVMSLHRCSNNKGIFTAGSASPWWGRQRWFQSSRKSGNLSTKIWRFIWTPLNGLINGWLGL